MPAITTHVLDTSAGRPRAGMPVRLDISANGAWHTVAQGATDDNGRLRLAEDAAHAVYRLTFAQADDAFYPEIAISFVIRDDRHHHIPLLLSPFGYSTYRGS